MRDIQMVDLKAQYRKIGPEIDTAIKSVLESTAFIKGPDVRLFEEELQQYMGVKHVITCANGTDALYMAMMVLGLKPGDEIITTNFTFIATVEVVALLGLKLVLIDPDPGTFNITPEGIKKAISPRTKAIVPVHLFGQCADMESIMKLARIHDLYMLSRMLPRLPGQIVFSVMVQKERQGPSDISAQHPFSPLKILVVMAMEGHSIQMMTILLKNSEVFPTME
jgi:UDP-2-acetamido-2-deoxy-ribo-hexuluronate aminotransferase